jgi:hypothetical protein
MVKLSFSKWSKYKVLKKSPDLKPHLPETYWIREESFWRLLNKFGEVILKPSGSYGGHGVLLIKSLGNMEFKVQAGPKQETISGKTNLYGYMKKRINKNFIVQRRISLASVNKRPFDLRVMVQRLRKSPWEVTGKLAKVAGKGYIITNMRRSSGTILPVKIAIKRSPLKRFPISDLLYNIDQVALLTAKQLKQYYPNVRAIGIDMGLDDNGNIWIIEANFKPVYSLFLKLKNKSMYRKIQSYRAYCKQKQSP